MSRVTIRQLAREIKSRWPWLRVDVERGFNAETYRCTADVRRWMALYELNHP